MDRIKEEEQRTALLLGAEALERLHNAHVAIFGVGGVGGYTAEALARAGIGHLTLVDRDTVSLSNINRQIIALHSTVGQAKVDAMKHRILDINPDCDVTAIEAFYLPENADDFPFDSFDYMVDAVDTVAAKIDLAKKAAAHAIPIISAMGAGNKLSAQQFSVTDLSKTAGCPLARVMRRELKKSGIHHLKVVYSQEPAAPHLLSLGNHTDSGEKRVPIGSLSFVPGVAGLLLAGEVIKDLCKTE